MNMSWPHPIIWNNHRLAQRVGSLRRSNDHLRMSLTAALSGESTALQEARDVAYERDEAMTLAADLREEADAWKSRCELLWFIADESKRDGVLGALGAIEGLPVVGDDR